MSDELTKYKNDGFVGFVKVADLLDSIKQVPREGGVYIVLRTNNTPMQFLEVGTGGFYKGENPNADLKTLVNKVVKDSITIYIGKGVNLRRRLRELLRFGKGYDVAHRGGCYMWQIADADEMVIAWKLTPNQEPRIVEASMIAEYVNEYGKFPFANRQP
jgi:hypothetical protein